MESIYKIYIVYEGEFETDKPREYMAKPTIHLVTNNKQRAINKFKRLHSEFREMCGLDYLSGLGEYQDNYFDFSGGYTYGCVGIIEQDLEVWGTVSV